MPRTSRVAELEEALERSQADEIQHGKERSDLQTALNLANAEIERLKEQLATAGNGVSVEAYAKLQVELVEAKRFNESGSEALRNARQERDKAKAELNQAKSESYGNRCLITDLQSRKRKETKRANRAEAKYEGAMEMAKVFASGGEG